MTHCHWIFWITAGAFAGIVSALYGFMVLSTIPRFEPPEDDKK